tara:strand:- start:51 stop:512 length:462 start_codon:yes stop_codon:yes gene_type:complete
MSMIPGGGSPEFYASFPSGPSLSPKPYGGATNDAGSIFADLKKKDSDRPTRTQKFAEAVDRSLKYKEQKEIDAEVGTDKDKDKDAVGPKGFKVSPDTTVVSGYTDPGFTLAGQKGRSFGGLIGTLGGAAIGLANPAIGIGMGSSIGSRVGSYF